MQRESKYFIIQHFTVQHSTIQHSTQHSIVQHFIIQLVGVNIACSASATGAGQGFESVSRAFELPREIL